MTDTPQARERVDVEGLREKVAREERAYLDRITGDLNTCIGRIPEDFPNYASWSVELPAGHWRDLAPVILADQSAEIASLKAAVEVARGALEAQMVISVRHMRREGFNEADIADCTAQARNALAKLSALNAATLSGTEREA